MHRVGEPNVDTHGARGTGHGARGTGHGERGTIDHIDSRGETESTRPIRAVLRAVLRGASARVAVLGTSYLSAELGRRSTLSRRGFRRHGNLRDLMISAANSWVPAFDDLPGISNDSSDILCRLSTAGR